MKIFALIEEMKHIREEALDDAQKFEDMIRRLGQRETFYDEQAKEFKGFSELSDLTHHCMQPLFEAVHKSYETIETMDKMIAQLEMMLPLAPPTF